MILHAGLLVGCLALRQRRRRRADAKTLKSSPSTPAVPPPTSPVLQRQRSMDSSGGSFTKSGGSFTKSGGSFSKSGGSFSNVGARPRSQTEQQMERTSSGKTHVIPYAQYKKSRLDLIRNDLGLQGAGVLQSCSTLGTNFRHTQGTCHHGLVFTVSILDTTQASCGGGQGGDMCRL